MPCFVRTRLRSLRLSSALIPTLLLLLLRASSASADVEWSTHAGLRLGLDAGLGTSIKYVRDAGFGGPKLTPNISGQLDLSLHHVFENPFGVGAHIGGALVPIEGGLLAGNMQALDIGPSLLLRLPISDVELSLRFPFGLSLGGVHFASRTLDSEDGPLRVNVGSNKLGVGAHAAALLGAQVWVSEHWALRFETGAWWRTLHRDEFFNLVSEGAPLILPSVTEQNVRHNLVTWTFTLGVQWGKRP